MNHSDFKFWIYSVLFFFIFPIIAYWGMVTNFHYDLFHPSWLWPAYNQYLLSMLDGRLDVPLEAIGAEGFLWKGKVYMYHGILPAVARLTVLPFVDLNSVPVSRLFIWLWTIAAAGALQWVVLKHYHNSARALSQKGLLITASILIWTASAYLPIVQNGSFYQEPYAASLFLMSVFLALFARDFLFRQTPEFFHLKTYALLAALSLHARPNVAIFLYLMTALLVLFSALSERGKQEALFNVRFMVKLVQKAFPAMLILGFSGVVLLLLNYLRFDNPLLLAQGDYGYRLLEGGSQKFCGYQQSGSFNILRILPHAHFYLFADYEFFKSVSSSLGLGYVAKGVPETRLIASWFIPLLALIVMIGYVLRLKAWRSLKDKLVNGMFILSLLSTLLILSYGTIEYRYSADLWMPFGFAILWSYALLMQKQHFLETAFQGVKRPFMLAVLGFCLIASPLYTMSHYELAYYNQCRRAGSYAEETGDSFVTNAATLELLRNPKPAQVILDCP
jgi:hypothetical protein